MTGAHLCEYEQWPGYGPEPAGRRPTPYLLSLLAAIYGCEVTELIDLADREHPKPAELVSPRYHGSSVASDLAGEIEDFSTDTIVGMLASLPS